MRHGATHPIVLLPGVSILVASCIALLASMALHRYLPLPAVRTGLRAASIAVGISGTAFYVRSAIGGEPSPEGAGHMAIFIFPLIFCALVVVPYFILTLLGLAIRFKMRTAERKGTHRCA